MLRSLPALLALIICGCEPNSPAKDPPTKDTPAKADPVGKKAALNKNETLFLEVLPTGSRRILIETEVCLREGQLELLLCRRQTKEHEAILTGDYDARDVHKALLACGAEPGAPVKWQPKYEPARGSIVKVKVRYTKDGKEVTHPAQQWIRQVTTKKDLAHEWVFAGSQFLPDPDDNTKPPYYTANSGDVICVSNFVDALLDLPVNSPKDNSELSFEAHTERIPPLKTKVTVILEPVLAVAKKDEPK
jgi:hypothetical protein